MMQLPAAAAEIPRASIKASITAASKDPSTKIGLSEKNSCLPCEFNRPGANSSQGRSGATRATCLGTE